MYLSVRDIFDLYRAMVPVQIGSKADEVPILALLVHNDCMYLAHHLMLLAQRYKPTLPVAADATRESVDITFLDLIIDFRKMAEHFFFSYMQSRVRISTRASTSFPDVTLL